MIDDNGSLTDPYSNFIALSRYARWRDDLNRRETWVETVDRYVNYMKNHMTMNYPGAVDEEFWTEAREAIIHHKVMPSMRALMTAGPALERSHVAGYNPVAGDTKVLTENGMVEIAKLAGTEQRVLNVDGRWADATFNSYGVQDTFAVAVKKNHTQQSQVVEATANHRWILNDGTVKPTSELKAGDRLAYASAPRPDTDNIDYELGVIHGLIYGDGTSTYTQKRLKGYHIRLCGSSRELLPLFAEHGKVCYPASANGDPVVMLYGAFAKTHELKQLPSEDETLEYLLGFIRGWMAADGSVGATGQSTLATTEAGLDWFIQNSARVGILHTGYHEFSDRTNFGDRKKRLFDLRLDRASLVEDDFLISVKRERFKTVVDRYYTVTSVEATGETKEVYCAEVPDTNTFVLDSGLVTGNCSFMPIDSPRAFDEALFILMNGTGLGFSAERKYTSKLPVVNEHFERSETIIKVADSKEGWARALRELIAMLYAGQIPAIDVTAVRPAGSRLKTFGGRSSGPQPLVNLFDFCIELFKRAAGRQLTSLECHDLVCKIAEVVVVGGVRRSALISLGDLNDYDMAKAKSGAWWETEPQRALANNSAAYYTKPSIGEFLREWTSLYESRSGERGIVNMENMQKAEYAPRRDGAQLGGTNPCGEISLRPYQFCNLTEIIVEENDDEESLIKKARIATILGTIQSSFTNFKYLRKIWKQNCEEERLLGVSLTGQFGNRLMSGREGADKLAGTLDRMRGVCISVNGELAGAMGINASAAITTVKPSGTVSQLTGTSSGMHPWHSEYYIRSVRQDNKDPLTHFMRDAGIPCEPAFKAEDTTTVFYFPRKAPEGAITRESLTAIEHLEFWKIYKTHWTEHNPSITVNVREHEWISVAEWIYNNWDIVGGISFLPYDDHVYQQAPYQDTDESGYKQFKLDSSEELDWSLLSYYEKEDNTSGTQTLSCTSGSCDLVGSGN